MDLKTEIRRIAAEEAAKFGLPGEAILNMSQESDLKAARWETWRRTREETGCTIRALAFAWGCWPSSIDYGLGCLRSASWAVNSKAREAAAHQFSASVRFLYPSRADAILAGNDAATNADLVRWNSLGRRDAA
jgi:hypothetical protein